MELSDLNEPERLLWAAFPRGAWVDLRTGDVTLDDPGAAHSWGAERVIRAEVISALLLGATEAVPGRVPGVWLRGARITGRLYLSGITFRAALECQGCFFEDDLAFVESTAQTIRITGSRLPSFIGARMRLDGLLDLSECVIDSIRLDYARLDSEVRLRGTIAGNDTAGIALTAEGLSVNGRLDCEGLRARGTVELRGGHISGPLNLTGAQITSLDERGAVVLHNLVVDGRFNADGMVVHGGLSMDNARIGGSMHLDGVQLRSPGVHGFALGGGGLTVEGSVWCRGGFCADGEVRFVGAKLGANLNLKGARLANPGGVALNLNRAAVGDVHCPNLVVSAGRLSLAGTQIGGGLSLQGASLEDGTLNDDTPILDIEGASMRSLELTRLTANGEVRVRTSRIEGRVFLTRAKVTNPGKVALRFSRTEIGADLIGGGLTVEGTIKLTQARVGRHVNLRTFTLKNPGKIALDARGLAAGELSILPAEAIEGTVLLTHARIGVFHDDPARWPGDLVLTGLTYEALEHTLTPEERLPWLNRDPEGFRPEPYEQLAAHYTAMGRHKDARTVLHAKERNQRTTETHIARAWSILQDVTVAYGYRPWRAALWLTLLLAAGSAVYSTWPPHPLRLTEAPHFNPVIYTLDLLLPIVDLGQKHAFNPSGAEQWFSYALVAAGWVLATTIAAGAARVISRR